MTVFEGATASILSAIGVLVGYIIKKVDEALSSIIEIRTTLYGHGLNDGLLLEIKGLRKVKHDLLDRMAAIEVWLASNCPHCEEFKKHINKIREE